MAGRFKLFRGLAKATPLSSTSSSSFLSSSSSHWFPSVGPLYPAPRFVFSAYRNIWVIVKLKDVFKRKNGTQTPDDEADGTLVDERVSQVIFIKESESSCAVSSSPVLSTSQSAPVVTSVDESQAAGKDSDSSSSVAVYIPVLQSVPAIASATVDDDAEFGEIWTALSTPVLPQNYATPSSSVDAPAAISPLKAVLNPSVVPFVPPSPSTATPPAREVLLPIIAGPKQDW